MANKYYAVKQGRKIGVFTSWEECKQAVVGFSSAIYKGFSNYDDAYNFVFEKKKSVGDKESSVFAYIDGSYDEFKKAFSYAGIIFNNGERTEFSDVNNSEELVQLRNVAGELFAAMYVMNYAKENNIKEITIYYDYAGIEMWATNKWKANLKLTQEYSIYAQDIMKNIDITFNKVKAHSGIAYNEQVDKLAKIALKNFKNDNLIKFEQNTENIFASIKGSKSLPQINILIGNNVVTNEALILIIKNRWKEKKRAIKEIITIKVYYDVLKSEFVAMVITETDENIIIIEGSEFNGKK